MTDVDLGSKLTKLPDVGAFSDIRTCDLVAHSDYQTSDAAHAGTTDSNEVNGAQVVWNGLGVVGLNHGL